MAVKFESVLAMKDESMVSMFRMIEASDLRKFMGCTEKVSKPILNYFFSSATMKHVLFKGINSTSLRDFLLKRLSCHPMACHHVQVSSLKMQKSAE